MVNGLHIAGMEWQILYTDVSLRLICAGRIFAGRIFAGRTFAGRIFGRRIFGRRIFTGRIFAGRIRASCTTCDAPSAPLAPDALESANGNGLMAIFATPRPA